MVAAEFERHSRAPQFRDALANLASVRDSVAVTVAPRAAQNSAVATPVRASPTTSTRLFFSSIAIATHYLNFSVVNANSAKIKRQQSRIARSLSIRSSRAVQNDDASAPCEKSVCRAA